jgi:sirohydrochlorin cobaltochelatase
LKQGIVLFAHGSRDPEWARPFERIAAALVAKQPAAIVVLAFLEHGASLNEAFAALAAKGAVSIRVVPVFLGQGGHVKADLPALIERARAHHPELRVSVDAVIGEQPAVIEAIAEAISSAR